MFQNSAETFTGCKIKVLHVDNTSELILGQMQSHCLKHGIIYEKMVPDSPPQNGVAKCTNLTLCSIACSMLINTNLRDWFWPFAILAATYIKQRIPHFTLAPHTTPFTLWFNHRPNLSNLHIFGSKCTSRIISPHLTKFQPCSENRIFLGYAKDAKGYLIWVPNNNNNNGTVKIRRDVVFHDVAVPKPSTQPPTDYAPLWLDINVPNPNTHSPSITTNPSTITTSEHSLTNSNDSETITHQECYPPHGNNSDHTTHNLPLTNTRPRRDARILSHYSDFIPSDTIIIQLLHMDKEELTFPLPHGPTSTADVISPHT